MVRRSAYQSAPPRFEYHLTESGRDLIPVLDALTAWGLDHAVEPDDPDRPPLPPGTVAADRKDIMTAELVETDARADWGPQRSRTVTWHSPGPSTAKGLAMSGIDYMRAVADGDLPQPPIAGLMQFDLVEVEPGRAVFTCVPDESAYNPIGAIHGGLICTLLDSVTGCAVHTTLPQGKGYTSIEIKVNYLKAVRLNSGLLTATGTVVKAGSRVGFTEGVVIDASGAVVATATSTLLIFDL